MRKLAAKVKDVKPHKHMRLKVKLLFEMAKMHHAMVLKSETEPSLDNAHYIKHGWIKIKGR